MNTWDELVERVEADRLLGTLSDKEIVAMGAKTRARLVQAKSRAGHRAEDDAPTQRQQKETL